MNLVRFLLLTIFSVNVQANPSRRVSTVLTAIENVIPQIIPDVTDAEFADIPEPTRLVNAFTAFFIRLAEKPLDLPSLELIIAVKLNWLFEHMGVLEGDRRAVTLAALVGATSNLLKSSPADESSLHIV